MRNRTWKHIVKITDLIYDEDLPFASRRDEMVKRLRESGAIIDGERGGELSLLVDDLADVDDADDYDMVMDDIYDLADGGKWLWVGP